MSDPINLPEPEPEKAQEHACRNQRGTKNWPMIHNFDPYDDALNDERQWKGCPMFE